MDKPMDEIAIKIENEEVNTAIGTIGGALLGLAVAGPLGAAIGAFFGASLAEARNHQIKKRAREKKQGLDSWR